MDFFVEPSPAGGYHVKLRGTDRPVSRHDTEEEAEAACASYAGGAEAAAPAAPPAAREPHFIGLEDGTQVIVRAPRAQDAGLLAAHPCGADPVVALDARSGRAIAVAGRDGAWAEGDWAVRGLAERLRAAV